MRTYIIVLSVVLAAANSTSFAGEAFVPQIGGTRQLAGSLKWPTELAAKIAAPIKVNAFAAAAPNTLPSNANVSSATQVGTNNFAMVAQTGGNNSSAVAQQGSGNQAIVNQRR